MKTSKAILILSAALGAGTSVYADKVTFSATPPAVQQAIKARSGSHEIEDIDRNNANGQVSYEASWKNNSGQQQELLVSENGSVLRDVSGDGPAAAAQTTTSTGWQPRFGTAQQNLQLSGGVKMSLSEAPKAVQETVKNMANGATIEDFERGTANGRTVYEAAFKRNGKNTELQVFDDGSLVRSGGGSRHASTGAQPISGAPRYAGLSDYNVSLSGPTSIQFNDAPAAVQTTLSQLKGAAPLENFARGIWNNRIVYEASYHQNGQPMKLQLLDDGSVLTKAPAATSTASTAAAPGVRRNWRDTFFDAASSLLNGSSQSASTATTGTSMSLSQTPAAVQQTVNQVTKGAALQSLQKEQWNGRTVYDASFQQNAQNMRVQVLEDGSILNMGPATSVGAPAGSQTGFGRQ
jgi:uncharacterized membrane protein YkoI